MPCSRRYNGVEYRSQGKKLGGLVLVRSFSLFTFTLFAATAAAVDTSDWAWLETQGFNRSAYELGGTWQERTRQGEMATGYALVDLQTGERTEHYRLNDRALSTEDLPGLGLAAKNWDAAPVSISAEPGTPNTTDSKAATTAWQISAPVDLTLPPLSAKTLNTIAAEDAASQEKGVWRAGVYRELPQAIHAGDLQSGKSMDYVIAVTDAEGIRLYIEELALPPGASLMVIGDSQGFGPYTTAGVDGLWTPTIFGEEIQIRIDGVAPAEVDAISLRIPGLIHHYRSLEVIEKSLAGSCNLDVNCYPGWSSTALGVGLMGTAGFGGSVFCTGTFIADGSDCMDVPLFLTANHCVSTQSKASSLEFFWQYQSYFCGGFPPFLVTVPRTTGGAVLLATQQGTGYNGGGNDFTLMRLNNDPPANITRVGWTTEVPTVGTEVTCIHHPRTEYKRISFGTLTDVNNVYASLFHEVTWDDGTTEPGSSGSALMLTATQQIIGQLWGGGASCSLPLNPDYYGRFDVTYAIAAAHLDPTPVANFAQANYVTSEDAGTVTLNVNLGAPAEAAGVEVSYSFTGGSATADQDYDATTVTTLIPAGQMTGSVDITILQDSTADADETIEVTLAIQSGCAKPGALLAVTTITIADDDADSDGDGISDSDEIDGTFGYDTDPNEADTDGDGLTDGEEVFRTFGYPTSPKLFDTDGDGYGDYTEILLGTDPTMMTSTGLSSFTIPTFR